jgi:curved DNA-binding protein CbpA
VYDIYDTLTIDDKADDPYKEIVTALTKYFDPKSNLQYNIYQFPQLKQQSDETLDAYHTRLKEQAAVCKFNDEDSEIKSQIILGCMSHKLRRLALEDDTMTLEKMLDEVHIIKVEVKKLLMSMQKKWSPKMAAL